MTDKAKQIPPDIAADLQALADGLLSLPVDEKPTLRHCLQSGATPPANLAGLLEAARAALDNYPEAADKIREALDAPQTLIYKPNPAPAAGWDTAGIEEFARMQLTIFGLLERDAKDRIADAIRNKASRDGLTLGDRYIWGTLLTVLTFPTYAEYESRITAIFRVTPEELQALKAEALNAADIKIPVEDETGYLPGLEPAEKRDRYPAPPYIYPPFTVIPTAELARNLHALDFQNTEAGALAKVGIDRRPHTHYVYMLMLDKLAEQYPITAGDKNILIALGNLYGERLSQPGGRGLQGGSIITAADIIRRFRGLDAKDRIDQQTIDAVTARMGFLMKLNVSFDFTQHFEYRKRDIGDGEEVELAIPDTLRRIDEKGTVIRFSYYGNMVHANTIEVEYDSGRIGTAWEILTPPIVFDYAQKIKQVATIETRLLDLRRKAKASTNNTSGADVMKIYLIERINAMLDPTTHQPKTDFSHSISLVSMFEDLRIEIANRVTKKNKIDTAKDILDHFKETPDKHRGTFIKGYNVLKGYRGAVTGFEILF